VDLLEARHIDQAGGLAHRAMLIVGILRLGEHHIHVVPHIERRTQGRMTSL
jgi:hypothetical protein